MESEKDPDYSTLLTSISCSHALRGNTDRLDRYPGMRSHAERGNEKTGRSGGRAYPDIANVVIPMV